LIERLADDGKTPLDGVSDKVMALIGGEFQSFGLAMAHPARPQGVTQQSTRLDRHRAAASNPRRPDGNRDCGSSLP
jgi:hypothetical protein